MRNRIAGLRALRGATYLHISLIFHRPGRRRERPGGLPRRARGAGAACRGPGPDGGAGPVHRRPEELGRRRRGEGREARQGLRRPRRQGLRLGAQGVRRRGSVAPPRLARGGPGRPAVVPDTEMRITAQATATGVQRIRAAGKANKGAGVHVAIIDTGIGRPTPISPRTWPAERTARRAASGGTRTATATVRTSPASSRPSTTATESLASLRPRSSGPSGAGRQGLLVGHPTSCAESTSSTRSRRRGAG